MGSALRIAKSTRDWSNSDRDDYLYGVKLSRSVLLGISQIMMIKQAIYRGSLFFLSSQLYLQKHSSKSKD